MIVREYNNGWGPDVELKRFENHILDQYLKAWHNDSSKTVIVNSTWYDKNFHELVLQDLQLNPPDRIVLSAMLDAAIVHHDWFQAVTDQVHSVGYYRGANTIDFWALAVDRYFELPRFDLTDPAMIDCAYMCLNRKPHWHRQRLYNALCMEQVVDRGLVSMGGHNGLAQRLLTNDQGSSSLAPNANSQQNGIANDIMTLGHRHNWQRHFLNVVTETWWDIDKTYFVSEKIYKPIIGHRPFLVYAHNGACEWLSEHGFLHYCNDFKDITDLDLEQAHNIPKFLNTLCALPKSYWQSKFIALQEKIMYNNNNFKQYVSQIKNKISKGIQCQT